MTTLDFGNVLVSLQPALRSYSKRFTIDQAESEDLLQDTVLKALLNRDKFQHNSNIKAWLYTIMKHTFINNYRKRVRRKNRIDYTKEIIQLTYLESDPMKNPGSQLEYKELLEVSKKMNQRYYAPFKLYFIGYKYLEISRIMKIPLGTVKTRIYYARKYLKSYLKNERGE